MRDPGEPPLRAGARSTVGQGHVRVHRAELFPAVAGGCPRAYRLFAISLRWATDKMPECGVRSAECTGLASSRQLAQRSDPPINSAFRFRIPHWLVGATILALLSTACQGDGRTPLVIYPPTAAISSPCWSGASISSTPTSTCVGSTWARRRCTTACRSERANPQADVWFGGPRRSSRGRARLVARAVPASWAGSIEPHGRGPRDLYYAAYETPRVIVYAEQAVKRRRPRGIGY